MGMILRIASSRIVGQGDIVGRSGYFSLNLSANSVMRGRLDARRTLKSLVADLRFIMFDVFSIVPVYAFVGEEPHVTYRILLNVEDSAVTQSVFYSYVFISLRRGNEG